MVENSEAVIAGINVQRNMLCECLEDMASCKHGCGKVGDLIINLKRSFMVQRSFSSWVFDLRVMQHLFVPAAI